MSEPTFIMLCGLPASGKSTYARSLDKYYTIHSSDDLRVEMFGDVNENSKESNDKLFIELHSRIKRDLKNGKNVIYDATNINRKRRIAFLSELKNIPCYKSCILIASPYYICLQNNRNRKKKVPENVIKRMYMNFQPPHISEGWDDIDIMFSCNQESFDDYTLATLYNNATGIDYFNQGNHHHSLTLGQHCRASAAYVFSKCPDNILLHTAALLHDEGKVFTMTAVNSKGERDGNCHYYQHHCVGAYDAIFYTYNLGLNVEEILYVSTLIYFHMAPYCEWKSSKKVEQRCKSQLGDRLFNDILLLHEADEYTH